MRILLVNWARIENGAGHGGGVNGYCLSIGRELARLGHQVASISSGTRYEPPADGRRPCRIEPRGPFENIDRFEVINSPVIAPSMAQFREPLGEVCSPDLERVFLEFVGRLRPDVVHVHNIEGLSAGCIAAARECGARVLYSLHNYHTLCPQVYLMQGHRRPCMSYDHGRACRECIPSADPEAERIRRASEGGTRLPEPLIPHAIPAPPWETIDRPAWRPLLNIIQADPTARGAPSDYAQRRRAMVGMLNSCHRVLAVSDFVRAKFESMGVSADVLKTLRIGSRMSELAARATRPPRLQGPLRIAFVGYHNWFKGLPMLLDSLELLTPEYLRKIHLTVFAINLPVIEPHLRRLEPRLAGIRTGNGYVYEELPRLLQGIDAGIVPSMWWDNAPQTVMEFHACGIPVLAAELGGIPEFVRDGVDGLLFRGADRWDLARKLVELVRQPDRLESMRVSVRPPKSIEEHVTELEREYADRVS